MKTTVEPVEGNNVKLLVEIEEAEFSRSLDAAFRKIAQEVRIPGFRPGKVPRRILEQRVGTEYARQTAIQDSLPDYYVQALFDSNVDAISSPELKLVAGEESGPISFEAVVEVRPTIRVPGYDGLQVTLPSPTATDDELDGQVDRMRNAFASLNEVDRQAQPGDNLRIDIAGTHKDEPVPGLTANDYVYEVGAGSVVPELDAALMGASAGETLNFSAAIPEGAGGDDQEGGSLEFVVTVKAVQEKVLPDANDEWAASASEFTTIAELRGDIARRMNVVKKVQATMAMRDEVVKALVELVDGEPPDTLVNTEIDRRLQDLANRLGQQGASIDMYLEATGQTQAGLVEESRTAAIEAVKADLALRSVAESESIDVSDEELSTEIDRLAERFKMKSKQVRSNLEKSYQMPILKADIRKAKAVTWLSEHASAIDADGKTIDRALLEVKPSDFEEAGESVEALGLESSVDFDDDDHAGHGHSHDGHDHSGHNH